jgi:hypothetical protein
MWTVIAAALGNLGAAAIFNVEAGKAAAMAGATAGINFLALMARKFASGRT